MQSHLKSHDELVSQFFLQQYSEALSCTLFGSRKKQCRLKLCNLIYLKTDALNLSVNAAVVYFVLCLLTNLMHQSLLSYT